MPKVALIIGHTPDEPGACNDRFGVCEYGFNEDLAQRIPERIQRANVELVTRDRPNDYQGLPHKVNATKADAAVSMHANSFREPVGAPEVGGTEVLFWHDSAKGETLARRLKERFLSALHLDDRGTKPRRMGERGAWLLGKTSMPCAICEPFFIDNDQNLRRAQSRKDRLACAYADGIDRWIYDMQDAGVMA